MSQTLGGLWDGELHYLEPDEFFPSTGAPFIIAGWEDEEEEDVLSPFESPTVVPLLQETGDIHGEDYYKSFPTRRAEQAHGALTIYMNALGNILEVSKKQYQVNDHENHTTRWTFQSDFLTERL
jgi:hypothetical protein